MGLHLDLENYSVSIMCKKEICRLFSRPAQALNSMLTK